MHLDVELQPRGLMLLARRRRAWRVSFYVGLFVAMPLATALWALIVTAIWLSS